MRQRNPGPYVLSVPTIGADVDPGEEIDYPDLVTGFEPVGANPEPPHAEPDKPARKTPVSKAAATAVSTEEA